MNFLIIYMSHHGTTEKVARQLKEKLGEKKTTVINLAKEVVPDLVQFDTIIIGGSIHMGQIQKQVRKFCNENKDILLKKRLGLFLCFMNKEQGRDEFETAFPKELREHSSANGLFGGDLLFDKMNFAEKFITRTVSGVKESVSAIDEDAVRIFEEVMER